MCNCLNEMTILLRAEKDDNEASIDSVYIFGRSNLTKPRMTASYRKKKKDGSYQKGNTIISVIPTFCPFCGVAYEAEKCQP